MTTVYITDRALTEGMEVVNEGVSVRENGRVVVEDGEYRRYYRLGVSAFTDKKEAGRDVLTRRITRENELRREINRINQLEWVKE